MKIKQTGETMKCKNCKHWIKKICEVKKLKTGANYGCKKYIKKQAGN